MKTANPNRKASGTYVTASTLGEKVRAFVPDPLPPASLPRLTPAILSRMEDALLGLGALDFASTRLPDIRYFLHSYVRKEALLSSQIEGTQSSLSDLMMFELEGTAGHPTEDVLEVSNYVAAMDHGMARLRDPKGLPLSTRLMREMHGVLLRRGRGSGKSPGEFRSTQNWIGGTRPGNAVFVPPPPDRLPALLSNLEKFIQQPRGRLPVLVKAALVHAQFETIHPFLDGNGRLGRLLIGLMLCNEGLLAEPMLYPSLYFKAHRQRYYNLLNHVRDQGGWLEWIEFFLEGIRQSARQAADTAIRLERLFGEDRQKVQALGAAAGTTALVLQAFIERPVLDVSFLQGRLSKPASTVLRAIHRLQAAGVVRELTGRQRNRLFAYDAYLRILNEGT